MPDPQAPRPGRQRRVGPADGQLDRRGVVPPGRRRDRQRRGRVVVFDRHFFCDYYATDIAPRTGRRPMLRRIHGYNLRRLYPRPDLVILLDAPAEVFFARKGEGTLESIELRRQEYLAQADMFRSFVIVDARQPTDAVVAEVREAIVSFVRGGPAIPAAAEPLSCPLAGRVYGLVVQEDQADRTRPHKPTWSHPETAREPAKWRRCQAEPRRRPSAQSCRSPSRSGACRLSGAGRQSVVTVRRHFSSRHSLLDGSNPRTHFVVGPERHGANRAGSMALLTAFLKDGSDVFRERHRRRRACAGLLGDCLLCQSGKEKHRHQANRDTSNHDHPSAF